MGMELDEAIRGRRSIRKYVSKDVSIELVGQVIEAATFAPSAKNGQQWRFTVLTGDAKRRLTDCFRHELEILCKKIGEENVGSAFGSCYIMEKAPVVIMVWNAGEMGWETEKHSVAAAIQNLLLKAYSLGLGSLWIGDIFFCVEALEQHLGKPWKLLAAVTIGYPAYIPKGPWDGKPRMTFDEVAEFLD
jgi:nitroreductase